MDWRTETTAQVRADYDALLRDAVDAAAEMLSESDSFVPFMLVLERDGGKRLRRTGGSRVSRDESAATRALESARDRADLRARAVVLDVTVSAPFVGDAVKVVLEHRDGIPIVVLVPYTATVEDLQVDLGAAHAAVGSKVLWG
ncbi:hypothetical protein ACWEKT_08520 [Nocardia takedensis]